MNVIIVSWKGITHPFSGGAEVVTHEYAKFWVNHKVNVHWFSNGNSSTKKINNLTLHYLGPILTGSWLVDTLTFPLFVINTHRAIFKLVSSNPDSIIIEQIHGLPFWLPLTFGSRVRLIVCEVAGVIWDKMFPFPVNFLGKLLEQISYRTYSRSQIWAISPNTAKDITKIAGNRQINILPIGIKPPLGRKSPKYTFPSALYIGRLVPMKGLESLAGPLATITTKYPDFKFFLIGSGSSHYTEHLKSVLPRCCVFLGPITDKEKYQILRKCHALIHPSYKEGYGLTLVEAASVGVITIFRRSSGMACEKLGIPFDSETDIPKLFFQVLAKLSLKHEQTLQNNANQRIWDSPLMRKQMGRATKKMLY
jgi:glycosyltransferase involved in cell wall biosynthesis